MTTSDHRGADEPKILVQERIAELERANQALRTKNEMMKLKDKLEAEITLRNNRVLEGINRIFSIVVQDKTEEELGNLCLSVALEVTGSQLGFVNLVSDEELLHDIAISEMRWEQCLMYDKTGHRRPTGNFVVHGLYGSVINSEKSLFTNDPPSHPDSMGLLRGHPLLTSFLGVPLVLDGKTMRMLGVANREGGYSSEQLAGLEAIAPAIVQALQSKKSEDDLREAYENLKLHSEELQIRSEELRKRFRCKNFNKICKSISD